MSDLVNPPSAMSTPGMLGADPAPVGTGFGVAPKTPAKVIPRTPPDASAARKALVKQMLTEIKAAKKHHEKAFNRMREDMDFAYKWGVGKQWEGQTEKDARYLANIVQRHVNTRVAALYAQNPTVVAKPKKRREFHVWDGDPSTLENAMMALQNAGMQGAPPPPWAMELLQDVQQGLIRKKMVENAGETLEILYTYFMKEQVPDFKNQMKQLVRRTETCGVGFIRIGYQRLYKPRMDQDARIADITDQMQTIDRLRADQLDGEKNENDAEYEELQLALKEIQSEPEIIVREGLVRDFPESTRIIIDTKCRQIQGFVGARWLAEEFDMTVDEVKEVFNVDVKAAADVSVAREVLWGKADTEMPDGKTVKVYCRYDRKTGLKYCLCEDYPDFLYEPEAPEVRVEQFFPYYALVFNAIEHPDEIYPPSDVRLLRSQQIEYNRIKEALRQHRIANRPLYVTPQGALEDEDKEGNGHMALDNYPAHAVLTLQGMKEGADVKTLLQPVEKVAVDPNLYESEQIFADMERVSGSQEANLGGTSGSTATESNIAEGSRLSSLQSNADDLDNLLSLMARDGGQILLMECSSETVMEIVGPGAVWPEMSRSDIVKELYLDIEAGSSGRPNKAMDIANFKEMGPLIMQIPGFKPEKLAKYGLKILDDRIDPVDFIDISLPSIVSMNGQQQPSTGDPATDPNMQGGQGAQTAPVPRLPAPGPRTAAPPVV